MQARHGMTSPDLGPSTSVTQAAMIINFWTNHANANNSAEVELFVNGRLRWGRLDADWSWVPIKAEPDGSNDPKTTSPVRRPTSSCPKFELRSNASRCMLCYRRTRECPLSMYSLSCSLRPIIDT